MKTGNFFWDEIVPRCYPHIDWYFSDLIIHDRESFKRCEEVGSKVLMRVGSTGTHIFSNHWFCNAIDGVTEDGWRYSYDFIEAGWKYNFGYKTNAVFIIDMAKHTIRQITWDQASEIFKAWWRTTTLRRKVA